VSAGTVLTGGEIDTLVALVENGPLWDGDVPSKSARDGLLERGFAMRCIVKGEDGWQAATYRGRDAYKAHFGNAETMPEAKANRAARRAINSASAR
jgi:hypothetical protein